MFAARNIDLCSKDCVCLFVCPTGATDTEDGQIDREKCLDGCRLCVDACPSGAIYLCYTDYPEKPLKTVTVANHLLQMLKQKAGQELLLRSVKTETPKQEIILKALIRSVRIVAEDFAREAGFLMPQSRELKQLLQSKDFEERLDILGDGNLRDAINDLF